MPSSLWYRPPEVLVQGVADALDCSTDIRSVASVDMWSVGCLFAEMMTGSPLFETAETNFDLLSLHCDWFGYTFTSADGNLEVKSPEGIECAPKLVDLVPGLCEHGYDVLSRMLACEYKDRISAAEALQHPFLTSCGCKFASCRCFHGSDQEIQASPTSFRSEVKVSDSGVQVDGSINRMVSFEIYPSFLHCSSSDGVQILPAAIQGLVQKRRLKRQRAEAVGEAMGAAQQYRRFEAAPAL
jgi:serine/threonine protein kinase